MERDIPERTLIAGLGLIWGFSVRTGLDDSGGIIGETKAGFVGDTINEGFDTETGFIAGFIAVDDDDGLTFCDDGSILTFDL